LKAGNDKTPPPFAPLPRKMELSVCSFAAANAQNVTAITDRLVLLSDKARVLKWHGAP
jgi:hypothetical protein